MAGVDLKEMKKNFEIYLDITEAVILLKIAFYKEKYKDKAREEVYKEFLKIKEESWKKKIS